jgi:Flp pilus assembly protein TadB
VFKNKGAIEVKYANLLQIYGYSFAVFIPLAFINCLLVPLNRLRVFLLLSAGAISLYYIYKETKEYLTKYIDE